MTYHGQRMARGSNVALKLINCPQKHSDCFCYPLISKRKTIVCFEITPKNLVHHEIGIVQAWSTLDVSLFALS